MILTASRDEDSGSIDDDVPPSLALSFILPILGAISLRDVHGKQLLLSLAVANSNQQNLDWGASLEDVYPERQFGELTAVDSRALEIR